MTLTLELMGFNEDGVALWKLPGDDPKGQVFHVIAAEEYHDGIVQQNVAEFDDPIVGTGYRRLTGDDILWDTDEGIDAESELPQEWKKPPAGFDGTRIRNLPAEYQTWIFRRQIMTSYDARE